MPALDLIGNALQLAHDFGQPHPEPVPKSGGGGGASAALVGGGVAATLAVAGGLIWVRERTRRADASTALEGDAHADRDEQRAGAAVEPRDNPRAGQEPA